MRIMQLNQFALLFTLYRENLFEKSFEGKKIETCNFLKDMSFESDVNNWDQVPGSIGCIFTSNSHEKTKIKITNFKCTDLSLLLPW